ncbi:hypothetical protein MJO28_000799, partial [Puccinia striiformis f. sp. tritici]
HTPPPAVELQLLNHLASSSYYCVPSVKQIHQHSNNSKTFLSAHPTPLSFTDTRSVERRGNGGSVTPDGDGGGPYPGHNS